MKEVLYHFQRQFVKKNMKVYPRFHTRSAILLGANVSLKTELVLKQIKLSVLLPVLIAVEALKQLR